MSVVGSRARATSPGGTSRRHTNPPRGRTDTSGLLFVAPAVLLVGIFALYPLAISLFMSFMDWDGLTGVREFIGVANYQWAFTDDAALTSLRNFALFALITIPLQMAIGVAIAIGLRGSRSVGRVVRAAYFMPVVLAPVMVGMVFSQLMEASNGPINTALRAIELGGIAPNWLGDPSIALVSVALVNVWMWTGFSMAIYQAGLDSVPEEVIEAARVDGASGFALVRHMFLPLLRPSHFSLIILGTISSLKGFDLVYVLTRGGPADSSHLPTTYMLKVGFELFEQGRASAVAVLIFVIAMLITAVQLRVYRRRGER